MQTFVVDISVADGAFASSFDLLGSPFSSRKKRKKELRNEYFEYLSLGAQDTAHDRRKKDIVSPQSTVIFRLDATVNWKNHSSIIDKIEEYLKLYFDRNEHNNQILLYSADYDYEIRYIHKYDLRLDLDKKSLVKKIRENELTNFVRSTYSLFEHGGHAYFELPSKSFSDYFFRVGNIQTDNVFSISIYFWCIPHLKNVHSLFADTWSISTTIAKISKHLSQYRSEEKMIPWEFSSNYLPYAEAGKEKLKEALSRIEDGEQLLFLSSFTSSGRLKDQVSKVSEDVGKPKGVKYLSIFLSSEHEEQLGDHLCNIKNDLAGRSLTGRCQSVPPANKPIFEVHPRTYFPDYRKVSITEFRVRYAKYKDFFERYAARDIFSAYKTGSTASYPNKDGFSTKNRHHAFHVSAYRLFEQTEFKQRLDAHVACMISKLQDEGRVLGDIAFLHNESEPSLKLCELIEESLDQKVTEKFVARNSNFLGIELDSDLKLFLGDHSNSSKTLIIVIPMVVGGGSLGNIQRELRSIVDGPNNIKPNILLVVGVMRPNSEKKARELSSFYLERDETNGSGWSRPLVIETVVLPNWQEQKCPWTRELNVILSTLASENLDPQSREILLERKELLEIAANEGLKNKDVFFTKSSDRLIFNPDSRFIDSANVGPVDLINSTHEDDFGFLGTKTLDDGVSEADLCCAVASAMQVWREEAQKSPLHFSTIDAATIDNLNGYNESRLRAAIWRSLTPKELSSVARAEETNFSNLTNLVFDLSSDDKNYTDLCLEALLAFQGDLLRSLDVNFDEWNWGALKHLAHGSKM